MHRVFLIFTGRDLAVFLGKLEEVVELFEGVLTHCERFIGALHKVAVIHRQTNGVKTGIADKLILKWTNHADLFRIHGVGPQFSELLEAAGVDTVKELSHRVPANLVAKMEEVNAEKHLVRRVPALKEVEKMVAEAKTLPATLTY